MKSPLSLLLLLVVAAGCRTTATGVKDEPTDGTTTSSWFVAPDTANARLYPDDEGPRDAPAPGAEWSDGPLTHDMQPVAAGRMYLLELYQQTIEDKESLEREIGGLTRALDQAYGELDARGGELEEARASRAAAEAETQRLTEENQDLAARLATAQVRRLEAEKMLLEAKIEWARFLAQDESGLLGERVQRSASGPRRQ